MSQQEPVSISRRHFLVTGVAVGAGLTLAVCLPAYSRKQQQPEAGPGKAGGNSVAESSFKPNAFVRIASDDRVTVIVKHLEMGQGTYTGLATLVAEELDAAWSQVDVEGAPADAKLYNNLFWGDVQGTGGSTAMANSFQQMRKAGAAARQMLVNAAASKWSVPAAEIRVSDGVLSHVATAKRASFGAMADVAAQQPVPEDVFLKDPEEFRLIGTRLPRKDSRAKTDGSAIFTQDIELPGLLTALVAHPPRFGAGVRAFDASEAKKVEGVSDVVEIPTGVAVLARDFWSAKKGRDALQVSWDESGAFRLSSDELMSQYKELAERPGVTAYSKGDAAGALQAASVKLELSVEFPFLAHASMEPMNCVMKVSREGCEIWNGEQYQTPDQKAVAAVLGMLPEQVKINMLYAGGSFGRRANPHSDYLVETAHIAKAIGGKAPVKLVWTREDDMRAGYYRPMYFHRLRAGLDDNGRPIAWQHRIVGQSIIAGTAFEGALVKDGVDVTSVEGAANLPYAIPNITVDLHSPSLPIPVQWWRSVGSTHTAFAVETFVDQLAAAAGADPLEFRRSLLSDHPRHLGVLQLAADKGGWGEPMAAGRGRASPCTSPSTVSLRKSLK